MVRSGASSRPPRTDSFCVRRVTGAPCRAIAGTARPVDCSGPFEAQTTSSLPSSPPTPLCSRVSKIPGRSTAFPGAFPDVPSTGHVPDPPTATGSRPDRGDVSLTGGALPYRHRVGAIGSISSASSFRPKIACGSWPTTPAQSTSSRAPAAILVHDAGGTKEQLSLYADSSP